ncbi:MAG: type II secretion system protein, partial [Gemmatimonadales bacterium]
MSRKGFTLIELLIVVVIIGILAAIAIPKFSNSKYKAVLASMKTDLRNLATAQEGYYFDFSTYAPAVGAAQAAGVVAFTPSSGNTLS